MKIFLLRFHKKLNLFIKNYEGIGEIRKIAVYQLWLCMTTNCENKKVSILNLLKCKCPRCRQGNMFSYKNLYDFKRFMKMNVACPVCGQPFDMEPGFYYGTSYVSYGFSIAITMSTFIAWWIIIGFSLNNNSVFYWLIVNAVLLISLQPVLMRMARTIWLAFFVRYDPDWEIHDPKKPYSKNEDLKDAW